VSANVTTDEEQLRHLMAIYAQRTDDGDARGKSQLFAEAARYFPSSGEVVGRSAIYATIAASMAGRPSDLQSKHMCTNSNITLTGDTAEAVTDYVVFRRRAGTAWEVFQIGRYHDKFERQNGTWLYSENRGVRLGP
jgi:3-phenylpropionate/cinnamic acid dioxygenase small subunit